jgi:FlaA1/EpsC-like NDP-sugar epimerase
MGEPVKTYDLAVKMITLAGLEPELDIPIQFTGLRPGEKLNEEWPAYTKCTIPTSHPRIRVLKEHEYNFDTVKAVGGREVVPESVSKQLAAWE